MTRDEAVQEAVKRLASFYDATQIFLIGSTARGEAGAQSDLDFVVVVPDSTPRTRLFGGGIQQELWTIPYAVDVVPVRQSVFKARSNWVMSLPAIALREGKLLYDAAVPR